VGDVVAITPGSHSYDNIQPDDMCVVTLDGSKVEGDGMVSSEWPMHQSIYANTKAAAVVHTHSPEVVALSTVYRELPAIHYAIANLGGPVRVVEYRRFGTAQLAEGVLDALSSRTAAILQNHGGVTCGSNLVQAYDRSLLLEWLAGVYRLSLQYGDPRILTEGELAEVSAEVQRRRYFGSEPNE
jgi:L-fuculose-phosphate aldolase